MCRLVLDSVARRRQAKPLHCTRKEKRGLDAGAICFGWPGEHTYMQSVEGKPTNAKFCSITYDAAVSENLASSDPTTGQTVRDRRGVDQTAEGRRGTTISL